MGSSEALKFRRDPLLFGKWLWPNVDFWSKQREIIESVRDNDETYVPAGNMLGKDFVAGFIALWYFVTHHPCRIITTSVTDYHLDVLWSEMDRYIRTSTVPLTSDCGGPLLYNHRDIRKYVNGIIEEDSYLKGIVATSSKRGEGLSGHHSRYTLAIIDEASGVEDVAYQMLTAWAKRILILGNPWPCANFFFRGVKGGNIAATLTS